MEGSYRGPDRRPTGPAGTASPHDRRALGAGAASGAGAAALVDVATGADPHAALAAVVGAAPLVVATVLLLCAWRVGGRARPAHTAVALALAGGAGPLAAWLASSAAPVPSAGAVTAVALAAGLLAAVPAARSAHRGAEVDTELRPGTAVLAGGGLVLAAGAGAAVLAGWGWLPALTPLVPVSPLALLAGTPSSLLWPAALGAAGGGALALALTSLRAALRAQRVRGLQALAGLQRSAAEHHEDRLRRHDARSALAAVRAASAVLTGEQPAVVSADEQRALAAAVHAELGRVERLLGEPSRPAAQPRPGVVDLREAVAPLVTAWRARGLDVSGPLPGPPVLAVGHPDAVRRAVANLLDNAARHAPGAAVVLTTATGEHDDGAVLLAVQDDGPGVPAHQREAVFSAGARLSAAVPGLGLGLASARALAEADGGSLRLAATDLGARFELRLPAARAPQTVHEEVTAR